MIATSEGSYWSNALSSAPQPSAKALITLSWTGLPDRYALAVIDHYRVNPPIVFVDLLISQRVEHILADTPEVKPDSVAYMLLQRVLCRDRRNEDQALPGSIQQFSNGLL